MIRIDNEGNYYVNEIKINERIFDEELFEYRIVEREDLIDHLIDWISEATRDKQEMINDLKYLIELEDEYIFSSISTNEYIAQSDNEKEFYKLCEDLLKLNEEQKK